MSSSDGGYTGPKSERVLPLPGPGETLTWQGHCHFNVPSLLRVHRGRWPGILNTKRDLLPLINYENGHVPAGSKIVIEQSFRQDQWTLLPVYLVSVNGHKVVLKLYCADNRQPGEDIDMQNFDFINDFRLRRAATREATAYAALEKAQGSLVPYCYGFYEFVLPNGIRCLGQVLELLSGDSITDYAKGLTADSVLAKHSLLRAIYTVLIELHKFGVVHRDAADRNMFLLRPIDPLNPRLVIFDFNVARTLDMSRSSQEKVKTSWLDMDKNRMAWFCEHMGEVVMNCKWAETDEGQSILQQWRKHPSKLTEEERRPAWVRQTEQSKL